MYFFCNNYGANSKIKNINQDIVTLFLNSKNNIKTSNKIDKTYNLICFWMFLLIISPLYNRLFCNKIFEILVNLVLVLVKFHKVIIKMLDFC
jgi:hypothetical protein